MTELWKARRAEADRGLETILHRANEKPRALQLAAKTGGVYFNEKMNEKKPASGPIERQVGCCRSQLLHVSYLIVQPIARGSKGVAL